MALMEYLDTPPPGWPVGCAFSSIPRPPADHAGYPHSAECRTPEHQPPWELTDDMTTPTWRRGPCGGHPSCSLIQHWIPSAPPPPRPDDDKLAAFDAEHGRSHVELSLEVAPGDWLGHWRARCTGCRATAAWWTEAARHYEAHGARITNRRIAGSMVIGGGMVDADPR
jgi:hypothetical protein